MSLTPEDIRDILKVLDDSPYDELQLDTDRFSLNLRRTTDGKSWQQQSLTHDTKAEAETVATPAASAATSTSEAAASEAGLLDVRAPMVGTFYRSPKPGAEPFVSTGSQVKDNSIIAIIEVMKLMNSVPARVSGEVVEIHVEDASLVQKGQLLMRVRP